MNGFTKLFGSILDSTIWRESKETRLVWITLLAMADKNGEVGASVPGLADRAKVRIDECVAALESFKQPDQWSRTRDNEGRRLEEIEGGWRLLNHAKYRAKMSVEDRAEKNRIRQARFRERHNEKKGRRKPPRYGPSVGEMRHVVLENAGATLADLDANITASLPEALQ